MIDNNKNLSPITFCGEIENEENTAKRSIKKVLKKLVDWYLFPWAQRQNAFNQDLQTKILQLENVVEDYKQKLDINGEKLNQVTEDIQHADIALHNLDNKTQCIDREMKLQEVYMHWLHVYTDSNEYSTSCLVSVDCDGLNNQIANMEQKSTNIDIDELGAQFNALLCEHDIVKKEGYIVIICVSLADGRYYEGIRKESLEIFNYIQKYSIYSAKLISFEQDGDEVIEDGDISYVGEHRLMEYLDSFKVKLLMWNCPVLNYAHCAEDVSLKYMTVMRITSQAPLQMTYSDLCGDGLDTLLHLNDYGFMHIQVLSETAQKSLEEVGFKNVKCVKPQIDVAAYKRDCVSECCKVVGFASSPMLEGQIEDRGVMLLAEIAKTRRDLVFKILWRDNAVSVPQSLTDCDNVDIIYGMYDMNRFYHEIDCLLIPYMSAYNNHACSLSAMEAMLSGIPVIATKISGVSEWVMRTGLGIVVDNTLDGMLTAFDLLKQNYAVYTNLTAYNMFRKCLQENDMVFLLEKIAGMYRPDNIVTMGEWQYALQNTGKELVIGRENIKNYYSRFTVAEHYTEQRFSSLRDKALDLFERKSIDFLIEKKAGKGWLNILDIASGDGRIVQEDIKYGQCTAMDASVAMLNLVRERFHAVDNLHTREGDYFIDEIEEKYDIITTFRYIRHFVYKDRRKIYKKICSNLKEDGVLIFDVPNIKFEMVQRQLKGWENYNIYDVFWTKESIINELQDNGFRVQTLIEVGKGLTQESDEPMTWTIAAVKK